MKKIIVFAIFVILMLFSSINTYACRCAWNNQPQFTEKEIFDKYENVFIGKIIDISKTKINKKNLGLLKQNSFDIEANYTLEILSKIKGATLEKIIVFQEIEVGYKECDCSGYSNPLKEGKVGDIFSLYIKELDINSKYFFPERYNKQYKSFKIAKQELLNFKNNSSLYFTFLIYKDKFDIEYNGLFTRNSVKTIMLLLLLLTTLKMFKYYSRKILYYIYLISVFIIILGMVYLLFFDNKLYSGYDYGAFQAYSMIFYIPLILFLLYNLYKCKKIKLLIFYIIIIIFYYIWGFLA